MRRICFVTGARSEYGLLRPIIERIDESLVFEYQIIAMGMHLSPEFGMTINAIEHDSFNVHKRVENLISSDSQIGMSKSFGVGAISISDAIQDLDPHMIVLLGDRYDTLMVACIANIFRIPVAHVHGGELTYGAVDDSFRHAITKLSMLHFTSTEEYRRRVIQMGEHPDRVYNVGAVGLDNIVKLKLLDDKPIRTLLSIPICSDVYIVTYHPETMRGDNTVDDFKQLIDVLRNIDQTITIVFTGSNCDEHGHEINNIAREFTKRRENSFYFTNLGNIKYLSLLRQSKALIGNSSSGILEAPHFNVPTINIGNRQAGRIKTSTVFDCSANIESISYTLKKALTSDCSYAEKIYGDGDAASRILGGILEYFSDNKNGIYKKFYDIRPI